MDSSIRIYNLFSNKVSYILKATMPSDENVPATSIRYENTVTLSYRWRPSGSGLKTQNVLTSTYADGTIIHWHVTSGNELIYTSYSRKLGKVLHTFRTG